MLVTKKIMLALNVLACAVYTPVYSNDEQSKEESFVNEHPRNEYQEKDAQFSALQNEVKKMRLQKQAYLSMYFPHVAMDDALANIDADIQQKEKQVKLLEAELQALGVSLDEKKCDLATLHEKSDELNIGKDRWHDIREAFSAELKKLVQAKRSLDREIVQKASDLQHVQDEVAHYNEQKAAIESWTIAEREAYAMPRVKKSIKELKNDYRHAQVATGNVQALNDQLAEKLQSLQLNVDQLVIQKKDKEEVLTHKGLTIAVYEAPSDETRALYQAFYACGKTCNSTQLSDIRTTYNADKDTQGYLKKLSSVYDYSQQQENNDACQVVDKEKRAYSQSFFVNHPYVGAFLNSAVIVIPAGAVAYLIRFYRTN